LGDGHEDPFISEECPNFRKSRRPGVESRRT
jgi:hypothetical protein